MDLPDRLPELALTLAVLLAVTVGVGTWARLGQSRAVLTATARALVQVVAVGAVIAVIFRTPALAPLYLAVMLTAASLTSGRRIAGVPGAVAACAVSIATGAVAAAAVVFACGALEWDARTAVPFMAQLVGGSMTATTLAGTRLLDDARSGWDEIEGWLALGARPRQALAEPARRAAARAVVPALDQTRNVGLVTLPGAFVGLLLGGASPLEAGRVQLLVLVGLLAAETLAAVVITHLLAARLGVRKPV